MVAMRSCNNVTKVIALNYSEDWKLCFVADA